MRRASGGMLFRRERSWGQPCVERATPQAEFSNQFLGSVPTGVAPFGAVLSADATVAWVSNWGGRLPKPSDKTAGTELAPTADQVVVDHRGVASTGTVTRIDLKSMQPTGVIPVELHPTAMLWDEERQRLYVANGNKDSVP